MRPRFFRSPAELRAWLENHGSAKELLVGFHKKHTAKPSITWPEAVDEALCFGWIDGVRKSLGENSYTIRFTPRKPKSTWSLVNINRVSELTAQGRMRPTGLEAFRARQEGRSGTYSYEQRDARFDPAYERKLRANKRARAFFESQAPSYRRAAAWWVMSAKREETRLRRLGVLIESSVNGSTVPPLTPPSNKR